MSMSDDMDRLAAELFASCYRRWPYEFCDDADAFVSVSRHRSRETKNSHFTRTLRRIAEDE